jgi:hypothetical protein
MRLDIMRQRVQVFPVFLITFNLTLTDEIGIHNPDPDRNRVLAIEVNPRIRVIGLISSYRFNDAINDLVGRTSGNAGRHVIASHPSHE